MDVVFSISPRGLTGNLIKRPAQTARIGTSLRFGGIEWSEAPINVVLAITTGCTYCQESAPFYKALTGWATQHRKVRVIIVSPEPLSDIRRWMYERGIGGFAYVQENFALKGLTRAPTLALVDSTGTITDLIIGKLSQNDE